MSTTPQQEVIAPPPICSSCDAELLTIGLYHWQHQGGVVLCIFCPGCRIPLHFEAFPIVAAQEPPRIVRSH